MNIEIIFTRTPILASAFSLASREIGAFIEFQGIVRETENGSALLGLEYEAYESMACHQLDRIFRDLARRHPIAAVVFIHRLGWVPAGEASLFIRVQSAHRSEALAFCTDAIDWMKRDVPIWKKA